MAYIKKRSVSQDEFIESWLQTLPPAPSVHQALHSLENPDANALTKANSDLYIHQAWTHGLRIYSSRDLHSLVRAHTHLATPHASWKFSLQIPTLLSGGEVAEVMHRYSIGAPKTLSHPIPTIDHPSHKRGRMRLDHEGNYTEHLQLTQEQHRELDKALQARVQDHLDQLREGIEVQDPWKAAKAAGKTLNESEEREMRLYADHAKARINSKVGRIYGHRWRFVRETVLLDRKPGLWFLGECKTCKELQAVSFKHTQAECKNCKTLAESKQGQAQGQAKPVKQVSDRLEKPMYVFISLAGVTCSRDGKARPAGTLAMAVIDCYSQTMSWQNSAGEDLSASEVIEKMQLNLTDAKAQKMRKQVEELEHKLAQEEIDMQQRDQERVPVQPEPAPAELAEKLTNFDLPDF